MNLNEKTFLELIKNAPLIAIDFIILNKENRVLLGKRNNEPAKDFWFVPGGRIRKNETLEKAVDRIFYDEFGTRLSNERVFDLPIAEHFYDVNVFRAENIDTHYIIMPKIIQKEIEISLLPGQQHKKYSWFSITNAVSNPDVHINTKNYLFQLNKTNTFLL